MNTPNMSGGRARSRRTSVTSTMAAKGRGDELPKQEQRPPEDGRFDAPNHADAGTDGRQDDDQYPVDRRPLSKTDGSEDESGETEAGREEAEREQGTEVAEYDQRRVCGADVWGCPSASADRAVVVLGQVRERLWGGGDRVRDRHRLAAVVAGVPWRVPRVGKLARGPAVGQVTTGIGRTPEGRGVIRDACGTTRSPLASGLDVSFRPASSLPPAGFSRGNTAGEPATTQPLKR